MILLAAIAGAALLAALTIAPDDRKKILAALTSDQRNALLRGESAMVGDRVYTLADLPEVRTGESVEGSAERISRLEAEVSAARSEADLRTRELGAAVQRSRDLEGEVQRLTAELEDARAKAGQAGAQPDDELRKKAEHADRLADLVRALAPADAKALDRLSVEQLEAVAAFAGIDRGTMGKDALVAAIVSAMTPQGS